MSENAITREQAQALTVETANWDREHAARVAEYESLAKRNHIFLAAVLSLCSALWPYTNTHLLCPCAIACQTAVLRPVRTIMCGLLVEASRTGESS
jgi:hypothetical protein